jgi:hypothetical protein
VSDDGKSKGETAFLAWHGDSMNSNPIERAFELARGGRCRNMQDLIRVLTAEGFEMVDAHVRGLGTRKELIKHVQSPQAEPFGVNCLHLRRDGDRRNRAPYYPQTKFKLLNINNPFAFGLRRALLFRMWA